MHASRRFDDRAHAELQRVFGDRGMEPLAAQQVEVAFENASWRVEQHLVRNAATRDERQLLRILPAGGSTYTTVTIPILADGRLLFLEHYGYAAGQWSLELPRSSWDGSDRGWRKAAEENLLRNTGLRSKKMSLIGSFQLDPNLLATTTLVVIAHDCKGRPPRKVDAASLVAGSLAVTTKELNKLLQQGEITCGTTLSALCLLHSQQAHIATSLNKEPTLEWRYEQAARNAWRRCGVHPTRRNDHRPWWLYFWRKTPNSVAKARDKRTTRRLVCAASSPDGRGFHRRRHHRSGCPWHSASPRVAIQSADAARRRCRDGRIIIGAAIDLANRAPSASQLLAACAISVEPPAEPRFALNCPPRGVYYRFGL